MTLICTTATSVSIFSRFGFYGVVGSCNLALFVMGTLQKEVGHSPGVTTTIMACIRVWLPIAASGTTDNNAILACSRMHQQASNALKMAKACFEDVSCRMVLLSELAPNVLMNGRFPPASS